MSLSPNDVWEFTDDAFEHVLEREQEKQEMKHRAESSLYDNEYRGTSLDIDLQRQVSELKNELRAERELNKTFHNTVIDSFREFSNDICKLDHNKACKFCHVFNNQYNQMMRNRSESSFRGTRKSDECQNMSNEDDTSGSDSEASFF